MEKKKNKILIVDDNLENIQVLANILTDNNFNVEIALNGTDSLKIIDSEDFDLILLDIIMPEMDGFEVCKRIKNDKRNKEIPIIFLTAKTDIESIQKAFKIGGVDYVKKPFGTSELLARVGTHIELKTNKDKLKEVNKWLEEKVLESTAEFNFATNKLLELDNAKFQFIQIMSHKIKSPLNGILGGLYLMKDREFTEEFVKYISILYKSTEKLENSSYDALGTSQFNIYNKGLLRPIKTNIEQIISTIIRDMQSTIKSKKVTISFVNNSTITILKVDPDYVKKCLFKVIDNAINYSPENGAVTVNLTNQNSRLMIEIIDEGVGFSKGFDINAISLFDTKEHVAKNAGLSLFLSHQIIEAHGGTIENGNNMDKGAFVKISMPIHD